MKFEPYGPFKMPRNNGGIDRTLKNSFWSSIDSKHPFLSDAVGCYIFALKAGKGYRPWYVGKTDKQCFADETWNHANLLNYGEIIRKRKGSPMLFLLAKITPQGRFQRPTVRKKIGAIAVLEDMLIATCLQRNSELVNKRKIKFLTRLQVPGYINETPGARTKDARALAQLLKT
jgi:hypothetical protein